MVNCEEDVINFSPFLKHKGVLSRRKTAGRFSPYKLVLFAGDCVTAILAFGLAVWFTGSGALIRGDVRQSGVVVAVSLMTITFFQTYSLYNYHLIFSLKQHVTGLLKSFGWSFLSLCMLLCVFTWPDFFSGKLSLAVVVPLTLGMMLGGRFLGDQLLNILKSMGLAFLAIGIIAMLSPGRRPVFIEQWLGIAVGFSLAAGLLLVNRNVLVHVVFNKWMRRRFRRQVAIIGSNEEARNITNHIIRQDAPFWVTGTIGPSGSDQSTLKVSVPKDRLGELKDLPGISRQLKIDEIIVTDEKIDQRALISLLDYCTSEGLTVWFPPKLMPIIDMKLSIDNFCGLSMIRLCSQKSAWIFNKIKHGLDAVITLPLFLLVSPVFLVIAFIIKLSSPGPVFYRARAIGKNGREFEMYKFRSMRVENSNGIHKEYVTKLIKGEICNEGKKNQVFKITDDPRITPIGKFLRKFRKYPAIQN